MRTPTKSRNSSSSWRRGEAIADRGLRGSVTGLTLAVALWSGCARTTDPGATLPPGAPIVLISIDTLRSDRLPAYGYRDIDAPHIDALRADSILFSHAYSHVPLTLPAHASMLSGVLPPEHGLRDNVGYRLDAAPLPWMPRLLKQHGYTTGAAVSSYVLRGSSGMDADFDFYDDRLEFVQATDLGSVQRPGLETLARALDWVRGVRHQPFFLFFHIYEPHSPYDPPEPFLSRYASHYDGEVAESDAIIGELITSLRELELYDPALIVLTSDHGEHLGEHGYFEHGPLLYREVLQVPLLVKLPGAARAGSTVEPPVQLIDLYPTIARLLTGHVDPGLTGRSLLEIGSDAAPRRIYSETFYARLHFGWSDLASIIDFPHHYIEGPDPELYDLASDPQQTRNILRQQRRVYGELKQALASYDRSLVAPSEEDPETRRRLEALGYLGSRAPLAEGALPDPKDRLHVLTTMREALELYTAGRWQEAIALFERVVAEEPGMVDAWEKLAVAYLEDGRHEDATAAFEQAMKLSGGSTNVALSAAEGFLRMNRLEAARVHGELALRTQELARDLLAQIAIRQGRLDDAEVLTQEAVASRGTRLSPLITQANLRLQQDRLEDALALTDQALSEFGDRPDRERLRSLYFVRGQIFAKSGDIEPAIDAFQQEIEISPRTLAPYTHLAFLYALADDGRNAGLTLQRMVQTNPSPAAYAEASKTLHAMGDERAAAAVLRDALRRWPADEELRDLARD